MFRFALETAKMHCVENRSVDDVFHTSMSFEAQVLTGVVVSTRPQRPR
jgi:hypothetical protein